MEVKTIGGVTVCSLENFARLCLRLGGYSEELSVKVNNLVDATPVEIYSPNACVEFFNSYDDLADGGAVIVELQDGGLIPTNIRAWKVEKYLELDGWTAYGSLVCTKNISHFKYIVVDNAVVEKQIIENSNNNTNANGDRDKMMDDYNPYLYDYAWGGVSGDAD